MKKLVALLTAVALLLTVMASLEHGDGPFVFNAFAQLRHSARSDG